MLMTGYANVAQVTDTCGDFDMVATVRGGGEMGQSQAVRLALSRALENYHPPLRRGPQTRGLHDARPAHGRAQEARPQEGPQGLPVGQALSALRPRLCLMPVFGPQAHPVGSSAERAADEALLRRSCTRRLFQSGRGVRVVAHKTALHTVLREVCTAAGGPPAPSAVGNAFGLL